MSEPKHTGCIGKGCPICAKMFDEAGNVRPKYVAVHHHLTGPHAAARYANLSSCVHRGLTPLRIEPCADCVKRQVEVLTCAVHGECTRDTLVRGTEGKYLPTCHTCTDRKPQTGRAILFTGGIGDVFTLEAMFTPEFRGELETIYYACPNWRKIKEMFDSLPNFPRLKSHIALRSGQKVYYERAGVEKALGPIPADVEDWSILPIFPKRLPYLGSSFLVHRIAKPTPIDGPYVVVVPRSRGFGGWDDRDFNERDWRTCTDFLERRNLRGAVLVSSREPIPDHPRLIDMQGKTSLAESVELLKSAAGYMGIDSCLSVLAAKLFPAQRLSIKSVNMHASQWATAYYAPWTTFDFVAPRLQEPPWTA